ncbi:MAG: PASTA domain-containing protein, partial [Gammaproteobacteria bacterium]
QLRPEDLENEAATGRKPSYRIEGTIGGPDEVWKSTKACFEGDSDLIDTEDGNVDPTFLGVGTFFKNTFFAITTSPPTSNVPTNDTDLPYPLSSDLTGAFTNGWYTTVDRDPFAWSYDMNPDPTIQDFQGSWLESSALVAAGGTLVSGPRWRLKPNKYGQDLPGLEIAIEAPLGGGTDGADCYAPPFAKDLIKYPVGEPTITEINLLDWATATTSPLKYSRGWVDVTQNGFVTVDGDNNGVPYTTNGLPMSDDLDLAVYIKGDRKATAVYDAQLVIDYAPAPTTVVPNVVDLPQATAEAAILAANLVVGTITSASHPTIVAGNVISTTPVAGTTVFEGTAVDLVISTGPGTVLIDVPNVIGSTQAVATTTLVNAGLVVGNVTQVSDAAPAGTVIDQSPLACVACVTAGSAVDLTVSTGPAPAANVTAEWVRLVSPVNPGQAGFIIYRVVNNDTVPVTGTATLSGTDGSSFTANFTNLAPGTVLRVPERWVAPGTPQTVVFTVTVTVGGVVTDTLTGSIVVQ